MDDEPLIYMHPYLVKVRAIAARKPLAAKVTKLKTLDSAELLAVVSVGADFDAIAFAYKEHSWSDVFHDLLRLQSMGLIRSMPGDRWAVVDGVKVELVTAVEPDGETEQQLSMWGTA